MTILVGFTRSSVVALSLAAAGILTGWVPFPAGQPAPPIVHAEGAGIGPSTAALAQASATPAPTPKPTAVAETPTPAPASGEQPDVQTGERIYVTSISDRGGPITYTGGPNFGGMMMGAYLTCAACHGPGGHGGVHTMMPGMQVMDAPDIRFSALNTMSDMQGKNRDYNLNDFKTEVEEGKDVDGEPLEPDMPRWQMSDADLQDVFAFLKSLP
jgi:hypothetical protein